MSWLSMFSISLSICFSAWKFFSEFIIFGEKKGVKGPTAYNSAASWLLQLIVEGFHTRKGRLEREVPKPEARIRVRCLIRHI